MTTANNEQIAVSVICNTYNHERYIRDALESFLAQKTTFAFEVLVHDDASTDRTAEIIREYEAKYPEIIKPIYETVNQYSLHNGMIKKLQFGRAKGKYIAVCEGDDYWTDPLKLQKQYDAMEAHPEVDMCAHAASVIRDGKIVSTIAPKKESCIIPAEDVILGGGGYFATNSLFYLRSLRDNPPKFYQYLGFDYSVQIWGSLRGGVLYLPDNMSVYRKGVENSWTVRMNMDKNRYLKHIEKVIGMLEILATEVEPSLVPTVNQAIANEKNAILKRKIAILEAEQNFREIKHGETRDAYRKLSIKRKIKITAKQFLHFLGLK